MQGVGLRDCVISRLTLFNARRGGEPARLTLIEWQDAENDVWVDQHIANGITDPIKKSLLSTLKITYQLGKGNFSLVLVLIPKDSVNSIKKLADTTTREATGVNDDKSILV